MNLAHSQADRPDGKNAPCARDLGYTPLVTEMAGHRFGNPGAQVVVVLMCNRCGAVVDAPDVEGRGDLRLPDGRPAA